MMTSAYMITDDGMGFLLSGDYKTDDGAIRSLLAKVCGSITNTISVRMLGAVREPKEVTAEWMMANCRDLTVY